VNVSIQNLAPDAQLSLNSVGSVSSIAWDASGPSGQTQVDLVTNPQAEGGASGNPCAATTQTRLLLSADSIPPAVHASLDCPITRFALDTPGGALGGNTRILYDTNPNTQAPEPQEPVDYLAIKNDSGYPVLAARLDGLSTAIINTPTGNFRDSLSASVTFASWNPAVYVEWVNNSDQPTKIELDGITGTTSLTYASPPDDPTTRLTYYATDPLGGGRISIPMTTSNTTSPKTFLGDPITNIDVQFGGVGATAPNLVGILFNGEPTYDFGSGTWGGTPTLQAGAYTDASMSNVASASIGSILATIALAASSVQPGGVSTEKVEGLAVGRLTAMASDSGGVDSAGAPSQMVLTMENHRKSLLLETGVLAGGASPFLFIGSAGGKFELDWTGVQETGFDFSYQNESTVMQSSMTPMPASGSLYNDVRNAGETPSDASVCAVNLAINTNWATYYSEGTFFSARASRVNGGCFRPPRQVVIAGKFGDAFSHLGNAVTLGHVDVRNDNQLFSMDTRNLDSVDFDWDLVGTTGNDTYPSSPVRQLLVSTASSDPRNSTVFAYFNSGSEGYRIKEYGDALNSFHVRALNPTESSDQPYDPRATIYSTDGISGNWTQHSMETQGRWNETPMGS
jgi:hypothetical protein